MLDILPDELIWVVCSDIEVFNAPNRRIRKLLLRNRRQWQIRMSCVRPVAFHGKVHRQRLWFVRDRMQPINMTRGIGIFAIVPEEPAHEEFCANLNVRVTPMAALLDLTLASLIHCPTNIDNNLMPDIRYLMFAHEDMRPRAVLPQFAGIEMTAEDFIVIIINVAQIPHVITSVHLYICLKMQLYALVKFQPLDLTTFTQCRAWEIC